MTSDCSGTQPIKKYYYILEFHKRDDGWVDLMLPQVTQDVQ
jgi:hypothetical protein